MVEFHATTICGVKKDGKTSIAGDGQVTMGESVIFKNSAGKAHLRRKRHTRLRGLGVGRVFAKRKIRGYAK